MAVIRCPHCNKPNPDIIEVCQYCDQPLRGEAGAAAPVEPPAGRSTDWLKGPADAAPTPEAPAAAPEDEAPDWLKAMQEPEAGPAPSAETPDWLKGLDQPEAAAPADDVPDWMKNLGGEADQPAAFEAEAQPAADDETPDWLKAMGQPDAQPTLPEQAADFEAEAQPTADADVPDWLRAMRGPEAEPSGPDQPAAFEAEAQPAADDETPDWLKAMGRPEAQPTLPEQAADFEAEAQPAADDETPDWLKAMRDSDEAPAKPSAEPADDDVPDWLKTMGRASGKSTAQFAEEIMAEVAEPEPAPPAPAPPDLQPALDEDVPDWLKAMRDSEAAAPAVEAGSPDSLEAEAAAAAEPIDDEDMPDWLKSSLASTGVLGKSPPPPSDDVPDWLKASLEADADLPAESPTMETSHSTDWLRTVRRGTDELKPLGATEAPEPAAPEPPKRTTGSLAAFTFETPEAEEAPDWLQGLRAAADDSAESEAVPAIVPDADAQEETPDWLQGLQAAEAQPEETPAEDRPDWLKDMGLPTDAPGTSPPEPEPAADEPDWLRNLRASTAEEAPAPVEEAPRRKPKGTAPFTTAPEDETPSMTATPTAMPDWLAALQPSTPRAEAGAEEEAGAGDLAQSALPSWLAAMRPVDIQRPSVAPEADDYEETVGILAGMRGVLRASSEVVLPRQAATKVHQLDYTPEQAKLARLFTNLVTIDASAAPARRAAGLSVPWERWLVVAAMLGAMLIAQFVLPGAFQRPADPGGTLNVAVEVSRVVETIQNLAPGRPALVAFDYEPAQAGELGPAATAIVSHLLRRGVPVVAVSLSPVGAAAGQAVLGDVTADLAADQALSLTYGSHYLNLGYVPGGAVGLISFAFNPRGAFRSDFAGQPAVWDQPLLVPLSRLSDFSAIVLIEASPETARAWVEQARQPYDVVGLTPEIFPPMLAVVSAGADPLVRPYYESGQISGMISGLVGVGQYEAATSQPGAALARWDVLGAGLYTALLLIVGGSLYHGAMQFLRPPKK